MRVATRHPVDASRQERFDRVQHFIVPKINFEASSIRNSVQHAAVPMNYLKETFAQFSNDRCTTLAAALAFYTALSLPPLIYLLTLVLTLSLSAMYDTDQAEAKAQNVIQTQASELIGNEAAADEIQSLLKSERETSGKWWKALLGIAGTIVGATGVVAALQAALNQVWEVRPDPDSSGILDVLRKRMLSLGMILGLGFLLLVSLLLSSVVGAAGKQIGGWFGMSDVAVTSLNFVTQALVVFVMVAAIFRFMPDAIVRWKDIVVGAVMTTALFLVGRAVLQIYFQYASPGQELGAAAASLVIFLVWVYYTGMIMLLGAEATQVYARMYGAGIRPEPHAVRVEEKIHRKPVAG
ncbi:hypothetical protein Mal65_26810 [Crateriforma conspicua]|nr:hypothetical protein Mal65_26810 [Crateriforma conspicua]